MFFFLLQSTILWAVSALLPQVPPSMLFSSGLVCFAHWRRYRRTIKRIENVITFYLTPAAVYPPRRVSLCMLLLRGYTEDSRLCCCGDINMPRRLSGCPSLFHLLPWSPRNTNKSCCTLWQATSSQFYTKFGWDRVTPSPLKVVEPCSHCKHLPWTSSTFVYAGKRFGRIFYGMDGFVGSGINYPMFY